MKTHQTISRVSLASVKPIAGELPEPEKPFEIAPLDLAGKFESGWKKSVAAGSVRKTEI